MIENFSCVLNMYRGPDFASIKESVLSWSEFKYYRAHREAFFYLSNYSYQKNFLTNELHYRDLSMDYKFIRWPQKNNSPKQPQKKIQNSCSHIWWTLTIFNTWDTPTLTSWVCKMKKKIQYLFRKIACTQRRNF